ncbi:Adaptive-response sensory-kinase SasA [Roseobacter fucihabitans]|uniref:histidine kinase n=1 Tax=Roseobacter fucihabitans TaxID=1537242 RepID=A0ABZ2C0T0_9RHOB|nr:HAMP domain-containing sensor histidine kinase [Roseobacter litoralis]MBC6965096.1 putative sensor histidine kinase TcrY [Roseobacter litoralis]
MTRTFSLKLRLGLGAALLGAGTLIIAIVLYLGLNEVAERLDTTLASENRMARYASLSTQASTFLVVATETLQTRQNAPSRMDRISPVATQMRASFEQLHGDVETALRAANALGLTDESRFGAQSLGLARMEATLAATLDGLNTDADDPTDLKPYLDSFASNFDQLLSQSVNTEVRFRNNILSGITTLRQRLIGVALLITALTLGAVAAFYFGLIRPQFQRLDDLRAAADQIGRADFSVALTDQRRDEIGQLAVETNRMAAALSARQHHIETEWARLNETINQRTQELQTANAALAETDDKRRRFFADISHELRTPLTVILLEAQIGKQGSPDPAQAFATIETRAARLNRRIDDLLRLARSDTGELALDPCGVTLPELLADVAAEIQAEIDNAGMVLDIADMPDITLQCDPNWVRQVIVSLIRNAIRHARAGQNLRLLPLVDDTTAGVSLSDNGPGIPPPDQARLFRRFAQGPSATAHQGFGVGLALARWVIEAQGGDITLTSPLPRAQAIGDAPGTKVSLRLPRTKP